MKTKNEYNKCNQKQYWDKKNIRNEYKKRKNYQQVPQKNSLNNNINIINLDNNIIYEEDSDINEINNINNQNTIKKILEKPLIKCEDKKLGRERKI